jgi:hypothetical protein
MTDKQGKEQQSYKSDASNVDLQYQHYSTGFVHTETVSLLFFRFLLQLFVLLHLVLCCFALLISK